MTRILALPILLCLTAPAAASEEDAVAARLKPYRDAWEQCGYRYLKSVIRTSREPAETLATAALGACSKRGAEFGEAVSKERILRSPERLTTPVRRNMHETMIVYVIELRRALGL